MEDFELSIVINRPIEEVFGFLANLENDLKWRSEWVEAKNTSGGSLGVGATLRLSGELFCQQIPPVYEVIEYESNQVAAWKAVSGNLPLTFRRRHTFHYQIRGRVAWLLQPGHVAPCRIGQATT